MILIAIIYYNKQKNGKNNSNEKLLGLFLKIKYFIKFLRWNKWP